MQLVKENNSFRLHTYVYLHFPILYKKYGFEGIFIIKIVKEIIHTILFTNGILHVKI